jgi:hypothetical protein
MSSRTDQISRLSTIIKTTSIKTVKISNGPLDMSVYPSSDIPLINIIPGEERPDPYMTGRFAMWKLSVLLTCYFLDDIDSESQREALVKEIKDAIGGDPTLNGTCAEVRVIGIRPGGEFPLWTVEVTLQIEYEKGIADA